MPFLSSICRSNKAKALLNNIRLIFPIWKDKGQCVADVTNTLSLQFNDDLETRIFGYGYKILPAGTMDTCASGVLVYGVSRFTSLVRWFRVGDRKYIVKGRLGVQTSTYDATGDVVGTAPYEHITGTDMKNVFVQSLGEFEQNRPPPPDSVVASTVVAKRPVVCHSIELASLEPPDFKLEVHCGAGCNMRSLVHDIGKALGSMAHVTSLERHQHGPFTLEHALPSYRWSWEEVVAHSEALRPLWYPYMTEMAKSMHDKPHLYQGRARYQ
ncbi:pseudouridylate synthase TRUB1-like [Ornithodoros turicata]